MYIRGNFFSAVFFSTWIFFLIAGNCALAQSTYKLGGMCYRQADITEKEMSNSIAAMRQIIAKKGAMESDEEEKLIASKGLEPERLNCVIGKLLAANDAFSLGGSDNYGISVSAAEKKIARKYRKDAQRIKKYMKDVLNITVE